MKRIARIIVGFILGACAGLVLALVLPLAWAIEGAKEED